MHGWPSSFTTVITHRLHEHHATNYKALRPRWLVHMPGPPVSGSFVLGISDLSWELLSRFATVDALSNLEELLASGVSGPLELPAPSNGPASWTSLATGARPDGHQVYGTADVDAAGRRHRLTSVDRRRPPVWRTVSPSFVAGVPMTHPVRPVEGILVPGPPTPDDSTVRTYPRSFEAELDATIPEYVVDHPTSNEELADHLRSRRLLLHRFMDASAGWSLQWMVISIAKGPRRIDPAEVIDRLQPLDDVLGEVMDYVERQSANLFVVSAPRVADADRWTHLQETLMRGGFTSGDDTGRPGRLERVVERLGRSIGRDAESDETAFAVGNAVFINDTARFQHGFVDPADVPTVKEDVAAHLGRQAAYRVLDGNRRGSEDRIAPDLVAVPTRTGLLYTADRDNEDDPRGVFAACGPNIRRGHLVNPRASDVVPTLLHSQLRAIPSSVDGCVLDVFSPSSPIAAQSPTVNT